MLTITQGDLFTSTESTRIITVNTVGVMGAGVALEFKLRYPEYYSVYRTGCLDETFMTGELMVLEGMDEHRYILFPTKVHFKYPSKIEWIESGLLRLTEVLHRFRVDTLALPPLGCGHGKLNFYQDVHPLLLKHLGSVPTDCRVYL